jgi:hypothetical protein
VGTPARLIDLEYSDRLSVDAETTGRAQVWLSGDAPADVTAELEARGLVIVSDTRAAQVRSQLDRQGPAIALVFYALAAVLAVGLGAGALILAAGVDRGRRAEDLTALREQGLGRLAVRRATLATYPALVVAAVVAGIGVALGTWWLTGWSLPLSAVDPHSLALPGWPSVAAVAGVGAVVLVVLAGVAYLAGWATLRKIR